MLTCLRTSRRKLRRTSSTSAPRRLMSKPPGRPIHCLTKNLRLELLVEGPVHPAFDRCGGLAQSHALQLRGEGLDLPVELPGPDGVHDLSHRLTGRSVDAGSGDGPLVGGGRPVVTLGDFGPVALLEDDLLLG